MIRFSSLFIFLCAQGLLVSPEAIMPAPAGATTFNVSSPAQLSAALTKAQSNGRDDSIRIAQGSYLGNFMYSSHEANSLSIQGGWTDNFTRRVVQPENTVLDGGKAGTVLVISCDREIHLTVEGITIQNGLVENQHGGGLYISNYRNELLPPNTTAVRDCIVRNNASANTGAGHDGGGIYILASTNVVIARNTVSGNRTFIATDNWYARGGGIFVDTTKQLDISNNLIYGNQALNGGGVWVDTDYEQVSIRSNIIRNNQATGDYGHGGGLYGMIYGPATIADNILSGNSAGRRGGGISLWAYDDRFMLQNNLLAENTAGISGGGASMEAYRDAVVSMTNNTIVNNQAGSHGGGLELVLYDDTTIANLHNNIVWNNDSLHPGRDLYLENDQDDNYLGSICNLHNNDFNQSGWGTFMKIPFAVPSSNLNGLDPLFVHPATGNYRLGTESPCLNSGSNTAPDLPAADIDGNVRIQDRVVDIGAYEGAFARNGSTVLIPLFLLLQ